MKKFIIFIIFSVLFLNANESFSFADKVPEEFLTSWSVTAKLQDTKNYSTFKAQSIDIWHLSKVGDKIILYDPITGITGDIKIKHADKNLIVFTKEIKKNNKLFTNDIRLRLHDNGFTGFDFAQIETYSLIGSRMLKKESAIYSIKGTPIVNKKTVKSAIQP